MEGEEEDLETSIWMPIIIDNKSSDKAYRDDILKDPNIREMDLAEISEKEVFVRKADLVGLLIYVFTIFFNFRTILKRASIIVSQLFTLAFWSYMQSF